MTFPIQLVVQNDLTKELETISMQDTLNLPEMPSEDEINQLLLTLYIKDRYAISHAAYHEMAKIFSQLPRQYKLQKKISEPEPKVSTLMYNYYAEYFNEDTPLYRWDINPMPEGIVGVQQNLEPRLTARLRRLIDSTPEDADFKQIKKIRVKLSGDETTMGKSKLFCQDIYSFLKIKLLLFKILVTCD